jgi:hypothetical protein
VKLIVIRFDQPMTRLDNLRLNRLNLSSTHVAKESLIASVRSYGRGGNSLDCDLAPV